jgi:ACS family tartrate transporter-like MFS transporter
VSARLLQFLAVLYLCNTVDRTNVAMAERQLSRDLGLSATAYALGGGIFLHRLCVVRDSEQSDPRESEDRRRWIARIAITWGLVTSAMMFVRTPGQFYLLRFVLGVAEAGLMPGVIYYLMLWYPARERGMSTARFMLATALAGVVGSPLGGWILGFDGRLGLHGWQWLFLVEGIPSVMLGVVSLGLLTDRPENARWLSDSQREWLVDCLRRDAAESAAPRSVGALRVLAHPMVWLLAVTDFLTSVPMWAYILGAALRARRPAHQHPCDGTHCRGDRAGGGSRDAPERRAPDRTGERCVHASAAPR